VFVFTASSYGFFSVGKTNVPLFAAWLFLYIINNNEIIINDWKVQAGINLAEERGVPRDVESHCVTVGINVNLDVIENIRIKPSNFKCLRHISNHQTIKPINT
jgi:hypothetical protein